MDEQTAGLVVDAQAEGDVAEDKTFETPQDDDGTRAGGVEPDEPGVDWLSPQNLPTDANELQEWLSARWAPWMRLLHELGVEPFTAWEFEQIVKEAEPTLKDIENGFASMYSPSCKAAEEKYEGADVAMLFRDAQQAIGELTAALHSVLHAKVAYWKRFAIEDWEREEIDALVEANPLPAGPSAAPERPRRFVLSLLQPGALAVNFKVTDEPAEGQPDLSDPEPGVRYEVQRRIGEHGHFEHLATTESLGFRDTSLPVGTRHVVYRVTPVREQRMGAPGYVQIDLFPESNAASIQENPRLA
ncbi:MAG: hypothetical protein ACIAQU_08680 [Phycisphaerales bacterium JB064]